MPHHIGRAKRKCVFEHAQNTHSDSSYACAKCHPGICSPLMHSIVSYVLLADSAVPDHIARMLRLIWAFAVRICPKTCFLKALPIWWIKDHEMFKSHCLWKNKTTHLSSSHFDIANIPQGALSSQHTTSQQRRYNVPATSWRCSDFVTTLCVCWENLPRAILWKTEEGIDQPVS